MLLIQIVFFTFTDNKNAVFIQVVLSNADVVTDETISRVAAINTGFVAVLTCTGGIKYETGAFAPLLMMF